MNQVRITKKRSWGWIAGCVLGVCGLMACQDTTEQARGKLAMAEQKRDRDSLVSAARLADEAVKLDSTAYNVYKRGMYSIEAGIVLEKNSYHTDAMYWLQKGVEDLSQTEGHDMHTPKAYYYRGVARSILMDKVGACSDLTYARSLGFPVKPAALEHAECDRIDSLSVELGRADLSIR